MLKPPLGTQLNFGNPLNNGLLYRLGLLEGGGNLIADSSLNGQHGVNNGAVWVGGDLEFSGTDNIEIPSSSLLHFSNYSDAFTIVMDVYVDPAETSWVSYISKSNGSFQGQDGFSIIHNMGDNAFRFYITSSFGAGMTVPAITGGWVTIAAVRDGTALKAYHNGVFIDETTQATGSISANPSILIANDPANQFAMSGKVRNAALYNRVLSASEIKSLYDNQNQIYAQDELALWVAATSVGAAPATGNPWNYYAQMSA
jgi:hypothetical protein